MLDDLAPALGLGVVPQLHPVCGLVPLRLFERRRPGRWSQEPHDGVDALRALGEAERQDAGHLLQRRLELPGDVLPRLIRPGLIHPATGDHGM